MIPTYQAQGLPFEPSSGPLDGLGIAPSCTEPKGEIALRREDTLGRRLAIDAIGYMTDRRGRTIQPESQPERDNDVAYFRKLRPGDAQWHWREANTGEHLIALNTDRRKHRFIPGEALTDTLLIDAKDPANEAVAVNLPPPVMLDFRDLNSADDRLLTDEQLDYFVRNGNNTLLFIHGYNVGAGDWGRFVKDERLQTGTVDYSTMHTGTHMPNQRMVPEYHGVRASVRQDPDAAGQGYTFRLSDSQINGTGARNWALHMEYQLNCAAGFDGEDWMPYSRIISISWPGDTGSTDFMQAEFNAMATGRRLIPLLLQLEEAGISVNAICHSLGARVILSALNILGTLGHTDLVDHVLLWQAAVADNALTNEPERDVHPLGMGVFPAAHQAARRVVVLHSRDDGVLGAAPQYSGSFLNALPSLFRPETVRDFARFSWRFIGNAQDDVFGLAHGIYNKKWWTSPPFLDNGLGIPIEALYRDYLPLTVRPQTTRRHSSPYQQSLHEQTVNANWARLEQDILREARTLWEPCLSCLKAGKTPPRYNLLSPLNHKAAVSVDAARRYLSALRELADNHWRPRQAPRPALGYSGFEELLGPTLRESKDPFIYQAELKKIFNAVDQTKWLFSHSGMRIPSDEIFQRSYIDGVMKPLQDKGSGFGSY